VAASPPDPGGELETGGHIRCSKGTLDVKFQQILKASSATAVLGAALASQTAYAQDVPDDTTASEGTPIVVTGSRIIRPNLEANSPIAVVTGEETVKNADVTLDTFLNTLPQVNPAGSTTSNNPGNGGQSNVDLRGLGSNRNLVLIDGRRPMVSASDQTVDLNTIPQGLIERIEVVTGGAGAAYGADAIAGVVNIRMKDNFEGIDLRGSYANTAKTDAREWQISGVIGGNFADNRGNIAVAAEHSERQGLIKSQRPFSAQATSTTRTFPTGRLVEGNNAIPQAAIDAVFATYGVPIGSGPTSGASNIAFNTDGTLFGTGVFNNPEDVTNLRDAPGVNPNLNFLPDFYSYNFDIINLLVLPYERDSVFGRAHYEVSPALTFFAQGGWTKYSSATALAPTPVSTTVRRTALSPRDATSNLIEDGKRAAAFIVPVTNPFIPADLATLLAARVYDPVTGTGDNTALVGNGATEPFQVSKRFLDTGLRQETLTNEVVQGLFGVRGEFAPGWNYEAYASKGKTTITDSLGGNVNVQKVQGLLEAADGGASICAGGFNPFGVQPLSAECLDYVSEPAFTTTEFTQEIFQGYITGNITELPAGPLSIVLGAEHRKFTYQYDAGTLNGPIAGFNTGTDDNGTNTFMDYFGELSIPLIKNGFVNSADLTLQARHSTSDFNDIENGINGESKGSWAYGATLSVEPFDSLRLRGSYQHTVRAPNFGELFSGGGSFPQYFDPCSNFTNFRKNGGDAARQLCIDTGIDPAAVDTYAQTPGSQVYLGITGNPNLDPESADTFTLGAVFQKFGFTGSIDYYNIRIKDAILAPDPNILIAACYGYLANENLDFGSKYCSDADNGGASIYSRTPDISYVYLPVALGGDGANYFQQINQGTIKTSGIDFQLGYNLPTEFIGPESSIQFNLMANYIIDYKVEELPGIVIDYADTVSYFGANLGTSFPRWKANLNTTVNFDRGLAWDTRVRYIDGMKNRASVQFIGEDFGGTDAAVYVDTALQATVDEKYTFRIGVNNLFDRKPELYAPNVQSGTDPSLFDVIGRRFYVQVGLKL
jgi:outer membrane receptor protein involved in Fe transport